jgi:hypothetical protein
VIIIFFDHLSSLKECCNDGYSYKNIDVEQKSFSCDFKLEKIKMLLFFRMVFVIRLKNKLREN